MRPALRALTSPQYSSRRAGASTTPSTGSPFSMSAMFTVNSSRRLTNSRVPSSGSTRKKRLVAVSMTGALPAATDSSAMTGIEGAIAARSARMIFSAASSAVVTGDASALSRTAKSVAYTAMMAPPARCAV
jgi:hypothetical protein